jgi:hypothetical protein
MIHCASFDWLLGRRFPVRSVVSFEKFLELYFCVLLGVNISLAASDVMCSFNNVLLCVRYWLDEHDAMMRFLATSVFLTKDTSEQLE